MACSDLAHRPAEHLESFPPFGYSSPKGKGNDTMRGRLAELVNIMCFQVEKGHSQLEYKYIVIPFLAKKMLL